MVEAETARTAAADRDLNAAEQRLTNDPNIGAALDWLDQHANWAPGTARKRVARELVSAEPGEVNDRRQLRSKVDREQASAALRAFYADLPDGYGRYSAHAGDGSVCTSILTRPEWIDLACTLTPANDQADLSRKASLQTSVLPEYAISAAVRRLAETLEANTRLVDADLYRLVEIDVAPGKLAGTFGLTSFVHYALTMDLLEAELADAIATGKALDSSSLPLRAHYMPDTASVLDVRSRLCAGGALALTAIARPAGMRRRKADYLLLVQERGGRVLNAARRLAVIPKSFHEPLSDFREDTQIGSTLRREMEEELFGRDDVDGTISSPRSADPMHPSRLSTPMRWLSERPDSWRMECTGFGLNLVSGNYEYASLVVIEDDEFWAECGGEIAANWESESLRQYSSTDREMLEELVSDKAWSNEGLFAFLQGLRRLAEIGGERVDAPTVDWELD
ncbi:transcriptional regulator [Prauserella oleivorans]